MSRRTLRARGSEPRPGPPGSRIPRVAFLGPIPPARTGVATYDRAVLDGLERIGFTQRHPIDVIWPVRSRRVVDVPGYELAVFQIGNNIEHHRDIYRLAWQVPGLVVLHDLALDDFVRGLQATNDQLGVWAIAEATAARQWLRSADARRNEPLRTPWVAAIARRARGIVVHAEFGRRYLQEMGCRTPVHVVPHPPVEAPEAIASAETRGRELRRRMEARGCRVLVVAPGELNEAKRLDTVFAALGALPDDVHLAVVGRPVPTWDLQAALGRHALGARVHTVLEPSDADFLGWLHAADVVIDLRFPHRGEVSGALARAMQVGRPTIVSATGTYLDEPVGTVVTIGAGPGDPAELAQVLRLLSNDPSRREAIGAEARRYMDGLRTTEATAHGYAAAIEETIAILGDPVAPTMARWARSLIEVGVSRQEVDRGYGVRYARALESFKGTS